MVAGVVFVVDEGPEIAFLEVALLHARDLCRPLVTGILAKDVMRFKLNCCTCSIGLALIGRNTDIVDLPQLVEECRG